MVSVVLFGVGSPLVVDYEESCARRGWAIAAGVRNVPGPAFTSADVPLVEAEVPVTSPVLVPLFTPGNRMFAQRQAASLGATEFPALTDPTSILPRRIEVGEGCYVNAGCVFGACAVLGRFVLVNRGARLGHHLSAGDFVSIGPGAVIAGQVTIDAAAMLGAGAVVLPGVRIGAGAVIAAGAIVSRDVPPGATVIGRTP